MSHCHGYGTRKYGKGGGACPMVLEAGIHRIVPVTIKSKQSIISFSRNTLLTVDSDVSMFHTLSKQIYTDFNFQWFFDENMTGAKHYHLALYIIPNDI
jgi:hypothetical protein